MLRTIIVVLLAIACQLPLLAQQKKVTSKQKPVTLPKLDRSKLPAAGPAPVVNIGKPETFELPNGLKVYVVQNKKLPVVSFNLVLDYAPIQEADVKGYVSMAGQLLKTGTTSRSKDQIDEEIDFIGASFSTSSTGFFASSLKRHSDKLLEVVSDVVKNPTFPQDQFDRVKKETLSGLASSKDNAEAIAGLVAGVLTYGENHPYGEPTTEATVKKITMDQVKSFYNNYYRPNVGHLAIVGDINKQEAQSMAAKYFGSWPRGNVPQTIPPTSPVPQKTRVVVVDKPEAVQSVIRIVQPLTLKPGDENLLKAKTMNDILGGGSSARLFDNLREKKAYTYGAYSGLGQDKYVGQFSASASVRNSVTDSAVQEFMNEIIRIRESKPTEEELKKSIASQTGNFVMSLERPNTVASFAISTARYNLPSDYYQKYLTNLVSVSLTDVQTVAQTLLKPDNMTILVVGKAAEIADKLKKFGEVEYYTSEGKKTVPNLMKPAPAGVTAESVLAKYVETIGGKARLMKVKDITTDMQASIQGNNLTASILRKAPNLYNMTISMGGREMGKTLSDGKNFSSTQMGQKRPISEEEKAQRILEQTMWIEMQMPQLGMKSTLLGVEKLNDEDAYKIEHTHANGITFFEHYSVSSGLKLRKTDLKDTPNGKQLNPVDYTDYKAVDGIQMPHKFIQKMGPQSVVFEVTSVKFNTKLKDSQFKVE